MLHTHSQDATENSGCDLERKKNDFNGFVDQQARRTTSNSLIQISFKNSIANPTDERQWNGT